MRTLILGAVFGLPLLLLSQDPKKSVEPEFVGIPQAIDSDGGVSPLERQPVTVAVKMKVLGLGGAKGVIVFKGPKAASRFRSASKVEFVVRLESTEKDPEGEINIDSLTVEKGTRLLVMLKIGAMGSGGKSTEGDSLVAIKYSKHGDRSIRFWPEKPLPPGEYVITTTASKTAFLFGID